MNTAGNGVAAMQNTTGDLQSLIPQPAGQKLRQQNFLAVLSGQPLTAEQTGSLSPAADALPNTAVLSDPVSLQNLLLSDQQALPAARENSAAGAVETNPVQQQASMTASALQICRRIPSRVMPALLACCRMLLRYSSNPPEIRRTQKKRRRERTFPAFRDGGCFGGRPAQGDA